MSQLCMLFFFFFQAEDGIRDTSVTGVQTCALPISEAGIAGAVPGFVPAGGTQAFAIAEVVAQRRDHTLVVRPRHRQRGVEGAPVAPPVARGERLEEPGPKDVLRGPDGGKGLSE